MMSIQKHVCPVCGWRELETPPYENMPPAPQAVISTVKPPYSETWGTASYEVCTCCGYEFGYDDDPGGGQGGLSFAAYLRNWCNDGMNWLAPSARPQNWSLAQQLKDAGLPVPEYLG